MKGDFVIVKKREAYVNPQIDVIDLTSDIITTSTDVSILPPDIGDIDQDSWT